MLGVGKLILVIRDEPQGVALYSPDEKLGNQRWQRYARLLPIPLPKRWRKSGHDWFRKWRDWWPIWFSYREGDGALRVFFVRGKALIEAETRNSGTEKN